MSVLYGGVVLERFRRPRRFGDLPGPDLAHEDVNPLCGDRLRVAIRLGPGDRIDAVRFTGDACAIAVASADLLAEMIEGGTTAEAGTVDGDRILGALQAPIRASRLPCVALPLTVLRGALASGMARRRLDAPGP